MKIPIQITFRNVDPSPAIDAAVRKRAEHLDRFHPHIMGCRVVVESRGRHHHKGRLYNVRVDVTVPGAEILATHEHPQDHAHEDVYVAIRDAFEAVTRQIEDWVRLRRGDVKTHEPPLHGRVVRLFPDYGFIETADGAEIYFHRNSVADGAFDRLEVGSEVRMVVAERESTKGWQATTVHPVGKHHVIG